jgi:Uma2 family endonuclease
MLAHRLASFARQQQVGRAVSEMLFDFTAMLQRKRRPDVAFVSFARWPQHRRIPRTDAWEVVPNLAVEVVSPSDTLEQVMEKVAEYFQVGVECVWVILPAQEQVYVYESPTRVTILSHTDMLRGEPVLPQFQLPVAALFDEAVEA